MSTRESFVTRFGESQAASIEAAADMHRAELLEGDKAGSDPFRDAIVICVGFECMSLDSYRDHHGITPSWIDLRDWIRSEGNLGDHDGPVDYLAMFAGAYTDLIPALDGAQE